MYAILISCVTLSFLRPNAATTELVAGGQSTMAPQINLGPLSLNFNPELKDTSNNLVPTRSQLNIKLENSKASDCPNNAVLLYILDVLTKSLPRDDKTMLEPEKFKYVLTIVKNFLDTMPLDPQNLELYQKFRNLEERVDQISGRTDGGFPDKIEDKMRENHSLQYGYPYQRTQNCQDIYNTLVNFINSAYSHLLRYCALFKQCNIKNGVFPFSSNAQFQPKLSIKIVPIQGSQNDIKYFPISETKLKEPILAGSDLINLVKNQEGKGIHNIMTVLQNYRPSGDGNIAGSNSNLNSAQNPHYNVNPEIPANYEISNLYVPVNKPVQTPNLQSNIYNIPKLNTMSWQNVLSALKGLSGNSHENQYAKLLSQNLNEGNNIGPTNPILPGVVNNTQAFVNGPTFPLKAEIPITAIPNADIKMNPLNVPNFAVNVGNKNTNFMSDFMKLFPSGQSTLPDTNIPTVKPRANMLKLYNEIPNSAYISTYFNNMQQQNKSPDHLSTNLNKTLYHPLPLPQQGMYNIFPSDQNQNQNKYPSIYPPPSLEANIQLPNQNRNSVGINQNPPAITISTPYSKYNNNNVIVTFPDNNKQVSYGDQLLDLNRLLGVTNTVKLNSIPNKNGVVELTYMLKKPKPVYEPQYYVKYQLPYQTLLYNLQSLLVKKPHLRNEPSQLYHELLAGSNITDSSKDLKGLKYEDILKLTSTNGTLITAKILEVNNTIVDETLKIVQKLNSKLPLEKIINFDINATKDARLESTKNVNGSESPTVINGVNKNFNPPSFDTQRKGMYTNINYPLMSIGQYPSLNYNPYSLIPNNQLRSTIYGNPYLKYGINTNSNNVPALFSQNLAKNYPRFVGYGR